nr:hypothetical protein [uncultured Brevundimonas sp.]
MGAHPVTQSQEAVVEFASVDFLGGMEIRCRVTGLLKRLLQGARMVDEILGPDEDVAGHHPRRSGIRRMVGRQPGHLQFVDDEQQLLKAQGQGHGGAPDR